MSGEQIAVLYKSVVKGGYVYLVVEDGDMPYLEEYGDVCDEDDVLNEPPSSAGLQLFNTVEGAEGMMQTLIELGVKRPSELKVIKLSLADVWSLIDELTVIAQEELGVVGLEIELIHALDDTNYIAWDTIYSQLEQYN